MSAQQIKSNINDLVSHIEDEGKLQACYIVLSTIANNDEKLPKTKAVNGAMVKESIKMPSKSVEPTAIAVEYQEDAQPHDLSLVLLANHVFKNSQPLSEAGILAFDDALQASLLKVPTLPNRL